MDVLNAVSPILDYITNTQIGGVLPLDILVHFSVGLILTVILLRLKCPYILVLFTVLFLAMGKEWIDSLRMVEFSWIESLKDIFVTMTYPLLLLPIRYRLRQKKQRRN